MTAGRSRNDDAHSCGKRQRKWALATIATRQVSAMSDKEPNVKDLHAELEKSIERIAAPLRALRPQK